MGTLTLIINNKGGVYMTNNREEKDMTAATVSNQPYQPLNKDKKELLKNFIGSISSRLDLNAVKDEWKNDHN